MNFDIDNFFDFAEAHRAGVLEDQESLGLLNNLNSDSYPQDDKSHSSQMVQFSPYDDFIDTLASQNQSASPGSNDMIINTTKKQPFKIIKSSRLCEISPITPPITVVSQTKKIRKAAQSARIAKTKQEAAILFAQAPTKYIPTDLNQFDLDIKTQRKLVQVVKNRISAQRTRDHNKALLSNLRMERNTLVDENHKLSDLNSSLIAKVAELEKSQKKLKSQVRSLKKITALMPSKMIKEKCNISIEAEPECIQELLEPHPDDEESFLKRRHIIDLESGKRNENSVKNIASPALSRVSSSSSNNSCFTKFFILTIISVALYSLNADRMFQIYHKEAQPSPSVYTEPPHITKPLTQPSAQPPAQPPAQSPAQPSAQPSTSSSSSSPSESSTPSSTTSTQPPMPSIQPSTSINKPSEDEDEAEKDNEVDTDDYPDTQSNQNKDSTLTESISQTTRPTQSGTSTGTGIASSGTEISPANNNTDTNTGNSVPLGLTPNNTGTQLTDPMPFLTHSSTITPNNGTQAVGAPYYTVTQPDETYNYNNSTQSGSIIPNKGGSQPMDPSTRPDRTSNSTGTQLYQSYNDETRQSIKGNNSVTVNVTNNSLKIIKETICVLTISEISVAFVETLYSNRSRITSFDISGTIRDFAFANSIINISRSVLAGNSTQDQTVSRAAFETAKFAVYTCTSTDDKTKNISILHSDPGGIIYSREETIGPVNITERNDELYHTNGNNRILSTTIDNLTSQNDPKNNFDEVLTKEADKANSTKDLKIRLEHGGIKIGIKQESIFNLKTQATRMSNDKHQIMSPTSLYQKSNITRQEALNLVNSTNKTTGSNDSII